jgi:hypothetical protein
MASCYGEINSLSRTISLMEKKGEIVPSKAHNLSLEHVLTVPAQELMVRLMGCIGRNSQPAVGDD